MTVALLLQVLGLVLILVAAFVQIVRGVHLGWLGLFFFFVGSILTGLTGL